MFEKTKNKQKEAWNKEQYKEYRKMVVAQLAKEQYKEYRKWL